MIATTCPVCGTQCRIAGDPTSVTRWYEPVMQGDDALQETGPQRPEGEASTHGTPLQNEPDVLCICGHALSIHHDQAGCCELVSPPTVAWSTGRYCGCDAFKTRKEPE